MRMVQMKNTSKAVETFNQEIDRILQGGSPNRSGFSETDQRALKLAYHLTHTNLSELSTSRGSLRRHLIQQYARDSEHHRGWKSGFLPGHGRAFAGVCIVMVLALFCVFGLFNQPNLTITPSYDAAATSSNSSGKLSLSRTMTVNHNPEIYPQPVPTPAAISAYAQSQSLESARTPMYDDYNLKHQFPIITTTVTK